MALDGSKQPRVSAIPPPRSLNVQKFAESRCAELEALHSIVANRLNNDFRSRRNKRRRTAGHDNRVVKNKYRKRQKLGVFDVSNAVVSEKGRDKKVPRRIRRRTEFRENPKSEFSTSGDGTKRLRTHVWHAKRFTMTKLWGFHLPLGLQGRGRGSRALLKKFKDGVLIHDASYYGAVQLEGPQSSLLHVLHRVLALSQSENISHQVVSGAVCGHAMLHHVGAPFGPAVAPVTYMWRPCYLQNTNNADYHSTDGCDESNGIERCSIFRQLWVWVHASAFNEGYDALKVACQKQMDETGFMINCISLQGKLANLEVLGSKALQLLQKILQPTSIAGNSVQLRRCSEMESKSPEKTCLINFPILDDEHNIFPSAILALTVSDPRALPEKKVKILPKATNIGSLGNIGEDDDKGLGASPGILAKNPEVLSSPLNKSEHNSAFCESMDLWDASEGICPPVEESVLCMERHHRKLSFFCLGNSELRKEHATSGGHSSCPIMLLNESNKTGSMTRWSIILPLSWVKAFWVSLVTGGARAIGLREKHWIACEVGFPNFPSDFPDCNAHSCFMATKAVASDEKEKLRPPAMRPVTVPVSPPWDSVRFAFQTELSTVEATETHFEELVSQNCLIDSDCEKSETVTPSHHSFVSKGIVARTADELIQFLSEIHGGDNLLLFPNVPDMKKNFNKFMKGDCVLGLGSNGATNHQINDGTRLCFLRVTLLAHRGGTFEEGAVVCAPHHSDITLCTSSVDNDKGVQMPPSAVRSYFEQQPSGKWELHIPEDPTARESHRWPIGFVTTGSVRGSKKPSGQALCEATLLARLREEQWSVTPMKARRKEIYVLVRNLRSTAYRLALATIVLEKQEEDLVFM